MSEEPELRRCPNCHTRTLKREGDDLVCSECKGRFPAPEPEQKVYKRNRRYDNIRQRHEYFESHRDEIVSDLLTIGDLATRKKWKIPDSTIVGLKNRWLTAEQKPKVAALKSRQPPEKSPQRSAEKHNYYEEHKVEIIADLLTYGRLATRKKWHIASPSSLFSLERRWLTPDQRARINSLASLVPAEQNGHRVSGDGLPRFPEFSNSWEPEVQVMWFEIYAQLSGAVAK